MGVPQAFQHIAVGFGQCLTVLPGGTVAARMAILAEGDAKYRDDILYLEELPLFHPKAE